jgi:hypothetical protein
VHIRISFVKGNLYFFDVAAFVMLPHFIESCAYLLGDCVNADHRCMMALYNSQLHVGG